MSCPFRHDMPRFSEFQPEFAPFQTPNSWDIASRGNFLRDALAGALGVPELEARARAAGLLGEHQHDQAVRPPLCLGRVTIEVPRQKPLERGWRRRGTYPSEWNSVSPGGGPPGG